jgi:hypothetical protein
MLAQMRAWIRGNMPEIRRLITYHDPAHHHGTIYKADNWHPAPTTHKTGAGWSSRPNRTIRRIHNLAKWERTP